MPFFVVKNEAAGMFLSMRGDGWVAQVEDAAVFTLRSTAVHSIRQGWREFCRVERIQRLPDRKPRSPEPRHAQT